MARFRIPTASAVVATLILATGSVADAAPDRARLIDLGPGTISAVNDRGDIVGFSRSTGAFVLWPYDTHVPVDLGVGADIWGPMGINNHGDVAGFGFLWRNGTLTRLSHPSGEPVWAAAVNDRDEVAGFRATSDLAPDRPFFWREGVFTDLGCWHGLCAGEAVGINNRGQVLVNFYAADLSQQRALLWKDGVFTDLGSLGGARTVASAINNRGMVIGRSEDATGTLHPFLWRDGTMVDLWPDPTDLGSEVHAMNEAGDAVGYANGHPVLWRHRGGAVEILPGRFGSATAINDRGDVAGTTFDPEIPDVIRTPFRWRHGRVTDLDILAPDLVGSWVSGVDDRGRVIGVSLAPGGSDHVVVWIIR